MANVVELSYYPVKGCAGISASEAMVTPAGLAHDRAFMVVSDEGVFRTQRRDPRLALILPGIDAAGQRLTLRAPDHGEVAVDVDTTGARRPVELFGKPFRGIDQGDSVAQWLTDVLGVPSRLVRVPPEHDRVTDGRTPGTAGWADSGALHVVSRSSLDLLNEKIAERGGEPLSMNRFRPNIVIGGWDTPHTEDRAHRMLIGDTELAYAKLAVRCAVTLVDQERGAKGGPEPIRTLASYRRGAVGTVFGVKFSVLRQGKMAVGDEVDVTAWGAGDMAFTRP
ncbi:MOSC domain-containing protein [Streptomyces sp. WM6386]|uniref:MOSC domain-containing protein n=1 Tax=Streptomyces sp. WM6386 TaxID=1415558 RepID=UPI00061916FC|nr:MOSC N-terminal beta barrel domain-containing protein [Streptomyces sp. WM6386]KKD09946.1 molybdenum cofactor sulfurase [Streptomyces sp. WM6386]